MRCLLATIYAQMAHSNLLFLLVLLTSGSRSQSAAQRNDGGHRTLVTLLTIKQDWGSPPALSSWTPINFTSFGYCDWAEVTCINGQVTALSFQGLHMTNPIPPAICSLKNLTYIDLSYNNLTGEFPTALYSCSALRFLDLSNNGFAGRLPEDINSLSQRLEHLNLSTNSFVGDVPSAIAWFPRLLSLLLDTNQFNGSYPITAISNIASLRILTLASNMFMPGPVPGKFGKLKKLTYLWMSGMNLTGEIPDSLSALTELTLLDMSENMLQGEIPEWVWKLQKLEYLYLYANHFTGGIGPDITAVNMVELDLSMNKLTRPIPETIGVMKNLTLLFLYYNNITGPIPESVGLLPNLLDVRLFGNRLSGPLPPELGKHSLLGNLEVSNNNLSGEVPETLCSNKKLYDIVLFNNSFSGALPANLGECTELNNIMIYNNRFTGEFPEKIWLFEKLTNVMIQNNDFAGILPSEISFNISRIQMGNNKFSGAIPTSATGLEMFAAENNWFSRGLPVDMTNLSNLTSLDLAGNQISGSIPPSVGALKKLINLNLSCNQISGKIPAAIGSLQVLLFLDLSNNTLTGDIPKEFSNLHLDILNLSSNRLTGEVPASLQSPSYGGSFLGNHDLCTGPDSGLPIPVCPGGHGSTQNHRSMIMIVLLVVLPGIALISTVVTVWLLLRCRNARRDVTSWKMTPFRMLDFTEHDIVSKISEENLIGRGGSGKVYRIHLCGDKAGHRTVAVKKIGNSGKPDKNLEKEFESEVRTLGDLRHDNIINLLCCICGRDTKLLVYEYMENGSLDRWLHHRKRAGPLDWPTRLSVAVDVARGLSYMHHDFTRPVIHRDVKCSNILLDCKFRAKIADFGLARILAKSGESESASAVCGTFGYIAPEYVYMAKVSEKVDVYSFGVVLLELATGRGPQDGGTESGSCLAKWASKRYKSDGPLADLVDSEILDPAYLEDMVAVFELGVVCTGEDPPSRPSISEVLHRLLQFDRNRMSGCEAKPPRTCSALIHRSVWFDSNS